ncbi:MAG: MtrB/PioB family outer membrane beta-barrel protein, partial [Actinomycetota bacterium]|nr:MtrB/PioB family outer membrane beta-barrel protein [Actinomycetota bacterium]
MTHTEQFEQVDNDRRIFMSKSPRMKLLTLCIGAALVQMVSLPALADSGVGADTVIGNARNPGYAAGPVVRDADVPYVKRTPSGQMYGYPPVHEEAAADGKLSGSVEVGFQHADDRNSHAKRNEYSDPQNSGLYINNFDLSGETLGEYFFNLNGGGVGQRDQFYALTAGQHGTWRVKAFYNETPHVFTSTFRPLYINNGTGRPVLNNGVAGIATTAAAVNAYLAMQPLTEVSLLRKKGGARVDVELFSGWKGYASFGQENRDGGRP